MKKNQILELKSLLTETENSLDQLTRLDLTRQRIKEFEDRVTEITQSVEQTKK